MWLWLRIRKDESSKDADHKMTVGLEGVTNDNAGSVM